MKIAFVADPPERYALGKDSTHAMMAEASQRGWEVHVILPDGLSWQQGRVNARARRMYLTGEDGSAWFRADAPEDGDPCRFDALLLRVDPPFDMDYSYLTLLLELAEATGARVINRPAAVRNTNEKLAIARFPQWIPPTLVSRDRNELTAFIRQQGPCVVKPLNAMGGAGVFRTEPGDTNLPVILETLTGLGRHTVMVQRFLPAIAEGDLRVLLIDGKAQPFGLARIPAAGEHRGNLAAGGRGLARPLDQREQTIAAEVGHWARQDGLWLVGLDIIGGHITEINVTSPTCFQEIRAQTGLNVAAHMLDFVADHVAATPGRAAS